MSRQTFIKLCSLLLADTLLPADSGALKSSPMPALFFGHGSPMNIIDDNSFTKMLKTTALSIPTPKAILVISAHWVNSETSLSTVEASETIYDFGGFPSKLYEVSYPAKGSQLLVEKMDIPSTSRGLDHGAWSILTHMYPKANIPVMQLSIDKNMSLKEHYTLGQKLSFLRKYGVLIIGSGGITHNLRYFDTQHLDATPEVSAKAFDIFVKETIERKQFELLLSPEESGISLHHVHPTLEHYIPLLYIAGIAALGEKNTFIHEGFQNKAFSMRAWKVG